MESCPQADLHGLIQPRISSLAAYDSFCSKKRRSWLVSPGGSAPRDLERRSCASHTTLPTPKQQHRDATHTRTTTPPFSTRCTRRTESRKSLTVAANASCLRWACHGTAQPHRAEAAKTIACSIALSFVTRFAPTLLPRRRAGVTSMGEQLAKHIARAALAATPAQRESSRRNPRCEGSHRSPTRLAPRPAARCHLRSDHAAVATPPLHRRGCLADAAPTCRVTSRSRSPEPVGAVVVGRSVAVRSTPLPGGGELRDRQGRHAARCGRRQLMTDVPLRRRPQPGSRAATSGCATH